MFVGAELDGAGPEEDDDGTEEGAAGPLGFQATPVVCHCLTYFCNAERREETDRAQVATSALLNRQMDQGPNSRVLELLDTAINPELRSVLHLPNKGRRRFDSHPTPGTSSISENRQSSSVLAALLPAAKAVLGLDDSANGFGLGLKEPS